MPSLLVSNLATPTTLHNAISRTSTSQSLENPDFEIKRNTLSKFLQEKEFTRVYAHVFVNEGVVLNSRDPLRRLGLSLIGDYLIDLLKAGLPASWKDFRGSFSEYQFTITRLPATHLFSPCA